MTVNKTFLITGGAGFIGSAVIRELISSTNFNVVNLDKLTYAGNLESLKQIHHSKRYIFIKADICDKQFLNSIFNKYNPDVVMNLAAETHVDRSIDGPDEFIKTNIMGTYTLLEVSRLYWQSAQDNKKNQFRFHHVSTDEVYGDLKGSKDLFLETTAYMPSSPYSASKASSDHLVRSWHRTYGLPIIITNCSNNYGPYQFPEKLIPHMIINALSGKALPVYGNGLQIRDWLHVEDHARALVKVALESQIGESFNIGGNNEIKNIDVVKKICVVLEELKPNKPDGISKYENLITHVKDRPGHDQRYAIDSTKIQKDLKWVPEETFDTGLRKTIEWYLSNQPWWGRVLDDNYQMSRLGVGN